MILVTCTCIPASGDALLLLAVLLQFGVGLYSYLWPKATLEHRVALGPYHRFLGLTVWTASLATMAVRGRATDLKVGGQGIGVVLKMGGRTTGR